MIKLIIFLLCFNFAFLSYFAQSQLIFKHLTTADGLPDDGIEWVIQDHLGFIWIASREGMVKYDGYEFQQYKVGHENTIGLDQDRIRVVFEDSRGDIWGGAEGYLNRYIRIKDTLITYKSDDNDPNALKGHGVYSIIEDSGGRIWLGNYRGWINYIERSELEKMDYNISFNHLRAVSYTHLTLPTTPYV
jgi:ligand-binding sensor domain-containing protein